MGNLFIEGYKDSSQSATVIVAASDSLHPERADYVCDDTNFETQMTDAIGSGNRKIFLMEGNYVKSNATGISLPSNTEIELAAGAVITLADGINADVCVFTNSDQVNGNANIILRGGRLRGNDINQTSGVQFGIDFQHVDGVVDTHIEEFRNGDVRFVDCDIDYTNRNYNKAEILLSDCESLDGWSSPTCGTVDLSTDRRSGSNSFHFTTTEANPCYVRPMKTWSDPIDMRFMDLSFWIKFNNTDLADSSCQITLYTSTSHNSNDRAEFPTMKITKEITGNEWYHMRQSLAGAAIKSGGASVDSYESLSHVYGIKIIIINRATGVLEAWVDDIRMVPAPMEPIFNLSFDNPDDNTRDIIAPQLVKRGYVGSIHPSQMPDSWIPMAKELYERFGWEICPHINMQTTVSDNTFYAKMVNLKSRLENLGLSRGARFCSFEGHDQKGDRTLQVRRVYSAWRSTASEWVNAWFNRPAHYKDIHYDFDTEVKPLIDKNLKYHATLFLMDHYIGDGTGISITEDELNTVLDYLHDTCGAKVSTFNEIFADNIATQNEDPRAYPTHSVHDIFMDVLAASTNAVHAAITGNGSEQEITTGITNPDVARNISITNSANSTGDVTIEGIDAKGNSVSEAITIVTGGTAYGDVAFATVTKITIPATVVSPDTISVGFSDKLGLSNVIYDTSDVYKVKKNNSDATIGTVNTGYDTVDCSTITGGDDFTIWYKSNLNIIS